MAVHRHRHRHRIGLLGLLFASVAVSQTTPGPRLDIRQVTPTPTPTTDSYAPGCSAANSIASSCVTALGGAVSFAAAPYESIVSCLCCLGEMPISPIYSGCSEYIETKSPDDSAYLAYSSIYDDCDAYATCGSPAVKALATPTGSVENCEQMNSKIMDCESIDFKAMKTSLGPADLTTHIGDCLCYETAKSGSSTWAPDAFSSDVEGCYKWAKTQQPEIASSLETARDFCNAYASQTAKKVMGTSPPTTSWTSAAFMLATGNAVMPTSSPSSNAGSASAGSRAGLMAAASMLLGALLLC